MVMVMMMMMITCDVPDNVVLISLVRWLRALTISVCTVVPGAGEERGAGEAPGG
eukprot:CAMPEP_0177691952 /NCGR_PEP_ID=MMETSP0484_2-20121128/1586_1 /TAXON_ID=354590 /ORGANISM="Rhodomonas lens, Strain RHODO" /LENGTH=53 /DNA_ID=CAMNT_0019202621 /DNA_START=122 /DNA_END=280 /DNA_ORIENTATION=-